MEDGIQPNSQFLRNLSTFSMRSSLDLSNQHHSVTLLPLSNLPTAWSRTTVLPSMTIHPFGNPRNWKRSENQREKTRLPQLHVRSRSGGVGGRKRKARTSLFLRMMMNPKVKQKQTPPLISLRRGLEKLSSSFPRLSQRPLRLLHW